MVTIYEYIYQLKLAKQIYNRLTTNKFSRDSPTYPLKIESIIREQLLKYNTVSFMGLWGGSKEGGEGSTGNEANKDDIRTLDFIKEIKTSLKHPSHMWMMFCDTHHIIVNGRTPKETDIYYNSLSAEAMFRSIDILRLSNSIGDDYGLENLTDGYSRTKASEIIMDSKVLDVLKESAKKHSNFIKNKTRSKTIVRFGRPPLTFFGKGITPEEIGRIYVETEIYFLKKIDEKYRESHIFFSFSDPTVQRPIAEAAGIPMLYLHSSGKGHHECPWYS